MKKSWASKTSRKDHNKYNCQRCSKEQEKARRRRQIEKGILQIS